MTSFRTAAKRFKVGLDVAEDVVVPAHEGLTAMQVAGPVEDSG